MSHPIHRYTLGGQGIDLQSPFAPQGGCYGAFQSDGSPSKDDVRISINSAEELDARALTGGTEMFITPMWRLARTASEYIVTGYAFSPPQAIWGAVCDEGFSHCKAYEIPLASDERQLGVKGIVDPVLTTLLRLVAMHRLMRTRCAFLVHAAGVKIGELVYLVPGHSGAGKSTFCKQCLNRDDVTVINDDRLLVSKEGGEWRVFGTPWPGELAIARNLDGLLGGVLFLRQGTESVLTPISAKSAFEEILPKVSVAWYDSALTEEALELCMRFVSENPVYDFQATADASAAEALLAFAKSSD